jgi:hypothetical protein
VFWGFILKGHYVVDFGSFLEINTNWTVKKPDLLDDVLLGPPRANLWSNEPKTDHLKVTFWRKRAKKDLKKGSKRRHRFSHFLPINRSSKDLPRKWVFRENPKSDNFVSGSGFWDPPKGPHFGPFLGHFLTNFWSLFFGGRFDDLLLILKGVILGDPKKP